MHATVRLAAFAAGLAVAGAGAAAIGSATDATPPAGGAAPHAAATHGHGMAAPGGHEMAGMAPMAKGADGTSLTQDGLTLAPAPVRLSAGRTATWRFRILDRAGVPVRRFERDRTKLLHLIVARSDLTGYQHLHPRLAGDGTFSVALKLDRPGRYRAIADFTTGHRRHVLSTTLVAPGPAAGAPLPAVATAARDGGYTVALKRPTRVVAGEEAEMTFTVTRGGRPVTGLQPYLGAAGHLVALHAGDLAYSHVHPTSEDRRNGAIAFAAELHKAGAYRLFLQFRVDGRVHTVAFTQHATKS